MTTLGENTLQIPALFKQLGGLEQLNHQVSRAFAAGLDDRRRTAGLVAIRVTCASPRNL